MRKGIRISFRRATALGLAWLAATSAASSLAAQSLVFSTFFGGSGQDQATPLRWTPTASPM